MIAARIDYSNIPVYEVRDADIELLALKAIRDNVGSIVVSPSSLPIASSLLAESSVMIACSVSYPSGAYTLEAKQEEIEELLSLDYKLDEFYMVMAVGRFMSGYFEETQKELEMLAKVAGDKTTKVVTEAGHLSGDHKKRLCVMAAEAGIEYIVTSTSFLPYDITLPTPSDIEELATTAEDSIGIVAAAGIKDWTTAASFFSAGASRVFTQEAEVILKEVGAAS
jgi:deoxyribose-phosphate aldolase